MHHFDVSPGACFHRLCLEIIFNFKFCDVFGGGGHRSFLSFQASSKKRAASFKYKIGKALCRQSVVVNR